MDPIPCIDLLVPCYNEQESAPYLLQALSTTIQAIREDCSKHFDFRIIIVDDGSTDLTVETFQRLIRTTPALVVGIIIELSRNFGKEAAILAGLRHCAGDACIILDPDLQDPPSLIPLMIDAWLKGYQVVNAVRSDRKSDTYFKQLSSSAFYSIFLRLSKLNVEFNASDFRLLDRVAMDAILSCEERIRFSKGFFAWVGFKQKISPLPAPIAKLVSASGINGSCGTMPWMGFFLFLLHPCGFGAISASSLPPLPSLWD
ncbi:MAG: glycosyltransferase family 2 protein [Cyanobacteriota bacterium]|nr:glycosyltransferase family 2 protein [Cyanobacteriota bacterium]